MESNYKKKGEQKVGREPSCQKLRLDATILEKTEETTETTRTITAL